MRRITGAAIALFIAAGVVEAARGDANVTTAFPQITIDVVAVNGSDGNHGLVFEPFRDQDRGGVRIRQENFGNPAIRSGSTGCETNGFLNDVVCDFPGANAANLLADQLDQVQLTATLGDGSDRMILNEVQEGGLVICTVPPDLEPTAEADASLGPGNDVFLVTSTANPCPVGSQPQVAINWAVSVDGGAGSDTIVGGRRPDVLSGGPNADVLNGGANADTVTYAGSALPIHVSLGDGVANEGTFVNGTSEGDSLASIEKVIGGDDDDQLVGDGAGNTLTGNGGDDVLDGKDNADTLLGGAGFDGLLGGSGDDTLNGGAENDSLAGQQGNDVLRGSLGRDVLDGGDDNDVLEGGAGADSFFGGNGFDTVTYAASLDAVRVSLSSSAADDGAAGEGDDVQASNGIEQLIGGRVGDILIGSAGVDTIDGFRGDDSVLGASGDDTLEGNLGDDVLNGGADRDVIHGRGDGDSVVGGPGGDFLFGDDGNDRIDAQDGLFDTYNCGGGIDTATVDVADGEQGGPAVTGCENVSGTPIDDGPPGRAVDRVQVAGVAASVTIACPRGAKTHCHGHLTLRDSRAPSRVLGSAGYDVPLGGRATTRVHLSRTVAALLQDRRRVYVRNVERGVSKKPKPRFSTRLLRVSSS
jgi:Ca2+-binding RTX toxin-like protein